MNFEGATAVVTGGAAGLGRAFCEQLGRARARVLIADIDREGAHATAERVERAGGQARVEVVDVRHAEQVEALAEAADAWFGATDLLINNAGVAVAGPIGEVALDDWKWQIDINVHGVIHGCHAWVPRMKQRGAGHILNVGSAAGLLSAPGMGPYNVAKAAVIALSETLYTELRPLGIKVSVLCPSFFRTGIGDSSRGTIDEKTRKLLGKLMDMSRVQAPEVARIALEACEKGQLYCLPMPEITLAWLLKRAVPGGFYRLLSLDADQTKIKKLFRV